VIRFCTHTHAQGQVGSESGTLTRDRVQVFGIKADADGAAGVCGWQSRSQTASWAR